MLEFATLKFANYYFLNNAYSSSFSFDININFLLSISKTLILLLK